MHHQKVASPETPGRVLHGARWYDRLTRIMTFGWIDRMRNELVELAAPKPGESILDVGCGTGTLAIALKSKVGPGAVHGIDASPEMIAVAKGKATSGVDFQVGLIEHLPFADASFDLVTSSLMLHHLPDDLAQRGLAEVRRVLKTGGRFVSMDLAVPSHSPAGHLVAMLGHARKGGTAEKLPPMLETAGFRDVQIAATRHKTFTFIRAS